MRTSTGASTEPETSRAGKRLCFGVILANEFTLSAFSLFIDTLRLASDFQDRSGRIHCDWEVLSSTNNLIRSSCGVQIAPTMQLGHPARFDYVVVVGGLLRAPGPIDNPTRSFLRLAAARGVPLIGLCTGSFILADLGVARGRRVCVSWLHHEEFRYRFPDTAATSQCLFIIDGMLATCAGGTAVADLAAHLVRRDIGVSAETNALKILLIDRARDSSEGQPRKLYDKPIADIRVAKALALMEQNLFQPLTITEIARQVRLSRRQLERIFAGCIQKRPAEAYLFLRLSEAKRLVLNSRKTFTEIAMATGFENTSHFSRRFRMAFEKAPSAMRRGALTRSVLD